MNNDFHVGLWLQAAVRAMPSSRPVYPRQPTFERNGSAYDVRRALKSRHSTDEFRRCLKSGVKIRALVKRGIEEASI